MTKRKLGWLGWLLAISFPAMYVIPFFIIFLIIYLGTESVTFLVLTILSALIYVIALVLLLIKFSKPADPFYVSLQLTYS